jgi:hypothetical protein
MKHSPPLLAAALLMACLLPSGCGPGRPAVVPVTGTVTVGGKPVAGATVLFQPTGGGVPGRGVTADDGGFTLTTFEQGDGAIVGRHRVAISKMTLSGMVAAEGDVAPAVVSGQVKETWATPQRYASVETSGLEVDVARGMAPATFALEAN